MEPRVRVVWTLFKVMIALAILIPLGMLALGLVFGLVRIAMRLAVLGLVGYGVYRVARFFLAPKAKPPKAVAKELPSADPYYAAAMRELDAELRH